MKNRSPYLIIAGIILVGIVGGMLLFNSVRSKAEKEQEVTMQKELEEEIIKQEEEVKKEQEKEGAKKDIKSYVDYLNSDSVKYDEDTDSVVIKQDFSESFSSLFKGTNAETIEKRLNQTRYNYTVALKPYKDVKVQPDKYIVECYADTVDKYGNKGNDIVMTFEIKGSELKKINFDNVYTIEDLGVETFTELYYSAYNE